MGRCAAIWRRAVAVRSDAVISPPTGPVGPFEGPTRAFHQAFCTRRSREWTYAHGRTPSMDLRARQDPAGAGETNKKPR